MASDSGYGQPGAQQQSYASYPPPPTQGYQQTPQTYGQPSDGSSSYSQSYAGYGSGYGNTQPAESFSQTAQPSSQAGYGQQAYDAYGQPSAEPPTGYGSKPPASYAQPPAHEAHAPPSGGSQHRSYASRGYDGDAAHGVNRYGGEDGSSGQSDGYRSRGRGGYDRDGRGPSSGMGGGDHGGFKNFGGPKDYGQKSESGGEDNSDNNTIFVQGLGEDVSPDQVATYFKQIGIIKLNKKTGLPMINLYTDKATGRLKGEATVSYEDPPSAKAAIEWFDGKEFNGKPIKVSFATRRPEFMQRGGRGGGRGGETVRLCGF
ncbi:RBP56 factor, partial [Amia calva]|nr:RBP56 factor [Amia calva]